MAAVMMLMKIVEASIPGISESCNPGILASQDVSTNLMSYICPRNGNAARLGNETTNETVLSIVDLFANETLLSIVDLSANETLLSIVESSANETLLANME